MNKTTSSRRKRWFFARSMARAYREWLETRSKSGNQRGNRNGASGPKAKKRPLFAEALEPRVLFSGSPMPVEEPVADDQGGQESVAHTSSALEAGLDAVSQFSFEEFGNEELNFSESDLERLSAEAIDRWEETGLSADQLEALAQINYVVTDLEGSALAFAEGNSIYIDYNAAGEDWFVDATEWLDEEFVEIDGILRATSGGDIDGFASGGVDMLSVLMHEQGHILGLLDEYEPGLRDSSMYGLFEEGERRILEEGQAEGAEALSLEGAHFAHFTGTLTQITVTDQASWNSQVGSLTAGHEVVFAGVGGNIAISGDVTVGALHFQTGNFTLTGGELTIDSGSIETDVNATINSVIEGNGDLTKTGVGTLVLNGSNTYTGVTTVSEGILELASDDAVNGTSGIHIDGTSTLQLRNVEVDRPIFANSVGFPGLSSSAIHVVGGGASEISGAITLERGISIKTRINANTSLVISGGISGDHNLALYDDSSGAAGIEVTTNPINIGTGTFSGHGLTLSVAGNTAGTLRADWGQAITLNVDNAFTTPPALIVANSSNASGMIDLNGHDLEVSSVTAGQVSSTAIVTDRTGTATLTVTSTSASTFTGVLAGGLRLIKAGTGDFTLSGNNTYTGVTNVNAGRLIVQSNSALGATSAGTVVSTTGQVLISGDGLAIAEPITLDGNNNTGSGNLGPLRNGGGANTWTGEITLGGWSRISNAGGTFVVSGGVTSPPGMNYGFVVNNSSGVVRFDTNPIDLDGGSIEFHSAGVTELNVTGNDWNETRVRWSGSLQTNVANALPADTVVVLGVSYNSGMSSSNGQLFLAGNDQTIGGLTDQGTVTRRVSSTSAATLTISNTADHTYAGTITDPVSIVKSGAGVQTLSGDNTYTGTTTITDGILNLEGAHTGGGVYTLNGSGAILTGSGSTDTAVIVTTGALSPGVTGGDETGTLSVGSLNLASTTGTITVDLDGTSNGDVLAVTGSVNLTGSILDIQSVANVLTGDIITILSKDDSGAVDGTFVGLAEGATHTQNGHSYKISYVSGDGNDVTLTALDDAPILNDDDYTVSNPTGEDDVLNIAADGVLANDVDTDGPSPIPFLTGVRNSANGAVVTVNADGSFSYDPTSSVILQGLDDGESLVDTFTYEILGDDSSNSGDGPFAWDFGVLGNLDTWKLLNGNTYFRSGDGDGVTAGDASDGFALDSSHANFLISSPVLRFDGSDLDGGGTVLIVEFGGGDVDGSNTPGTVPTTALYADPDDVINYNGGNSNVNGHKSVAFFNVFTNSYDAFVYDTSSNGGTNAFQFDAAQLQGLGVNTMTGAYELHYFDTDSTGWGWQQLNRLEIAASTPVASISATVSVLVNGANDDIDAVADNYEVNEGASLGVDLASGLLGNDRDADDFDLNGTDANEDAQRITHVNGAAVTDGQTVVLPSGASLTIFENGTFTYAQNGIFNDLGSGERTTDSFTYTVTDDDGVSAQVSSDTATVLIEIQGANDAPTAVADTTYTVGENGTLTVTSGNGVLANDVDPDAKDQLVVQSSDASGAQGNFTISSTNGIDGGLIGRLLDIDNSFGENEDIGLSTVRDWLLEAPAADELVVIQALQRLGLTPSATVVVPRIDFGVGTTITQGDGTVLDRSGYSSSTIPPWQGLFNDIGESADMDGDQIAATFTGRIEITTAGTYNFTTRSDDGSVVYIDGEVVTSLNRDGGVLNRTGSVYLTAGMHDIFVGGFEGGGGAGFQVSYSGADTGSVRVNIPPTVLFNDLATPGTFVSGGLKGEFYDLNNGANNNIAGSAGPYLLYGIPDGAAVLLQALPSQGADSDLFTTSIDFGSDTLDATGDGVVGGSVTSGNLFGGLLQANGTSSNSVDTDDVAALFEGYFLATADGSYTFGLNADNGAAIFIDDGTGFQSVVSANGGSTTGSVTLAEGLHPIVIAYYEDGGGAMLQATVSGPGITGTQVLGAEHLSTTDTAGGDGSFSYDPNGKFDYLSAGETAQDSFDYTVRDRDGQTSSATATVTITGENDEPVVSIDSGDSVSAVVVESDAPLNATGTVSVTDIDLSDEITGAVTVASTSGNLNGIDVSTLLGFASNPVVPAGSASGDATWVFNGPAFDHLTSGEEVVLVYTLTFTDGNGGSATQDVTITIFGTDEAPVATDDTNSAIEAGGLNNADKFVGGDGTTTGGTSGNVFAERNEFVEVGLANPVLETGRTGSGGSLAGILTDTFAYDPEDPTGTLPFLSFNDDRLEGFHNGNAATDSPVTILLDLTDPVTIRANSEFVVDLYGRDDLSSVFDDRDDDIDIAFLDAGGAVIGTVLGQSIPNDAIWHTRVSSEGVVPEGTTISQIRVIGNHQSFALMEIRAAEGFGDYDPDPDDTTVPYDGTVKVTNIAFGGTAFSDTGAGAANSSGVVEGGPTDVDGQFGTLTINPDGSYSYLLDDAASDAIAAGESQTDEFTYTISDEGSPGLMAGFVAGNNNTATPNPGNLGSSAGPDAFFANDGPRDADREAAWGDPANKTIVYTGQIYLEAGDTHFLMMSDDTSYLSIDGALVINAAGWNTADAGTFTNSTGTAGWFDVEIRTGNGGGGYGFFNQSDSGEASWAGIESGFLMKSGGAASVDPGDAGWGHPEDPGDGTLFRHGIATDTATLTITVNGTNDVPVISVDTGDSIAETLAETNAGLSTTGTLSVTDFDTSDTVSAAVTSVVVTGDDNGLGNAALLAMLTTGTNPVIGNTATTADINWTFDSGSEAFNYLAASETLVLEYTITATDSENTSDTQTVTITIRGVNDAPELSNVEITSESEGTETRLSGTITDADFNGDGYTITVDWADANDAGVKVYDLANLDAADGTYNDSTGAFTLFHTYADDDPTGDSSNSYTVSVQVWETLGYKLEALYNFDEGDARDGTANGNDGTISGGGITFSTGDAPAALNGGGVVNGEDAGYINVAHSASLGEIDDQLTVSFWIKAELADNDDWFRIIRKGNAGNDGTATWMVNRTGSTDEVNVRTDTFPDDNVTGNHNSNLHYNSGSSVIDGSWHHVTYVLDNGDASEYVDGVLNHTQTYLHGDGLFNTDALQLLGRSSSDGIFGSMDDIALYSRALSAAEVAQLASAPVPTNVSGRIEQVVTTVSNAAPTVALTAPAGISENGAATLEGTITDPGTLDTFTLSLNWGDSLSPGNTQSFTLGATALTKGADGIDWNPVTRAFSIDHQYLDDNPGSSASDNYTIAVTVTDDDTLAGMNSTAVTVSNVAPVITVGALDSAAASLTETNAALSVSGTLTVTDAGTLDTTLATLNGTVAISGSSGSLTNADVLPMLTLSNTTTGTVGWTFDSSSKPETFDFLAAGETLTLTYTVTVTDDDTGADTQTIAITITGTNDAPVAVNDRYYFDEDSITTVIGNGNVTAPGLYGAQLLYETVGFTNFDSADNYTTDNSAGVATGSFDRVAYYLELDGYWVWVSMDAFNPDASLVGVPADNSGIVENGTVVTNLTIESNHPNVASRTIPRGIIEFWASNYGGGGGGQFNSSDSAFDWKDSGGTTLPGHGSFQVADITPGSEEMIFSVTGSGIGIGNQPTGNPDWTFGPNSYSVRNLQVWVGGGESLLSNDVDLDIDGNAPDDTVTVVSAQGSNLVAGTVTVTSDKGASVIVNADGTFSYDPSASAEIQSLSVDEVTTDTFTYTISDGAVTSSASVTISVNGRNDAPVANDDAGYSTTEDSVLTITAPAAAVGFGNVVNAGISDAELLYETLGFTHFDNADNYTTDNSSSITPGSFERVGYYIELDSYFVWVSMDAFNPDASLVGVPADYSGIVENGTVVTNLTIESNHPNVASRTIPQGIIEFWASNYNGNGGGQFGSNDGAFDWKDSGGSTNPGHGSFQVADITPGAEEMIFSITGSAMGFGNQPGGGDSPDWTFNRSGLGNSYTVRNLQVWVGGPPNLLANDSEIDVNYTAPDDRITVVEAQNTALAGGTVTVASDKGASVTVNADGTFVYDPNGRFEYLALGESTLDTFEYTISDGNGGSSTATVTVTVNGTNDAPVAVNDGSFEKVWQLGQDNGSSGEFEQEGGGSQPAPGSATARDNDYYFAGTYGIGTVTEDEAINDGIPGNSGALVGFERALTGGDPTTRIHFNLAPDQLDNELRFVVDNVSNGASGLASGPYEFEVRFNGNLVYTGEITTTTGSVHTTPSFTAASVGAVTGENVITITKTDSHGGWMSFDRLTLESKAVYTTDEDSVLTVAAADGVLTNDSDIDVDGNAPDDVITVTSHDAHSAAGGLVTVNPDGSFNYDPFGRFDHLAPGELATDTFNYTITDSHGLTSSATVTVEITGANDDPVAVDDGTLAEIWRIGIDNHSAGEFEQEGGANAAPGNPNLRDDDYYFAGEYGGTIGTVAETESLNDGISTSRVYGFERAFTNGTADSRIHFNLDPGQLNDDFVFTVDFYQLGGSNTGGHDIRILFNGVEIHSETITAAKLVTTAAVSGATVGAITGDNVITVERSDDRGGYILMDYLSLSAVETHTTDENTVLTVGATEGVLSNDSDVDTTNTFTVTAFDSTSAGGAAVTVNADGSFTYDPNGQFDYLAEGETVTDAFEYTITDSDGGSDTATVTIIITGVNTAPVANPDTNTAVEAGGLNNGTGAVGGDGTTYSGTSGNVMGGTGVSAGDVPDTDVDSDDDPAAGDGSVVVTHVEYTGGGAAFGTNAGGNVDGATEVDGQYGTLIINPDGSYDYLLNPEASGSLAAGEFGTEEFTYTISDSVIYADDFSGSGVLNSASPDTAPGAEAWTSSALWNADGTKASNGTGSAWLPFSPEAGKVYTLSADVNPDLSTSGDWLAIGFGGLVPASMSTSQFQAGGNNGAAWMLFRENDAASSVIQTFGGPATAAGQSHDLTPDVVGNARLEVILDTTGANWKVEWKINGTTLRSYTYGTNPVIESVGLGGINSATGSIDNFSLVEGEVSSTTLTITVEGTNDTPVITSTDQTGSITETVDIAGGIDADPAAATGTITFDDADLTDTHTATILPGSSVTGGTATLTAAQEAALLDNLSLGAVQNDTPADGSGAVGWTYTVPNSEIDFLAAGETVEVTHTVAISDAGVIFNGDFSANAADFDTFPGYLGGANPGAIEGWTHTGRVGINPVVAPGSGSPFANNGANSTPVAFIQRTGSISQTVTGLVVGQTYVLSFDYNERATGGSTTVTATIAGETFTDPNNSPVGGSNPYRKATLIFTATATSETLTISAVENEGTDQTTLIDNVRIDVAQKVVVTLTGSNDSPVITSPAQTGAITETVDNVGGVDADPAPATGTITFDDTDLSDTHTVEILPGASVTGGTATLTAAQVAALLDNLSLGAVQNDTPADGSGKVDWSYTVPNSEIDFLSAGETVEVTHTVVVSDSEMVFNGNFEANAADFDTYPGYISNPGNPAGIEGWTHVGAAGLNHSGAGGPGTPFANNGDNSTTVAFIQRDGSISQTVSGLVVGQRYALLFDYNERVGGGAPDSTTVSATIAGATFTDTNNSPVGGSNPYRQATLFFTATATSETLTISSLTNGGDQTTLIDNVRIGVTQDVVVTLTGSNDEPVVNVAATDIIESESTVVTGNFNDPDLNDTHTITVSWGDPNSLPDSVFSLPKIGEIDLAVQDTFTSSGADSTTVLTITSLDKNTGEVKFTVEHQYIDDDVAGTSSDDYTVTVTVTDDDTGVGSDSEAITVSNLAPEPEPDFYTTDEEDVLSITTPAAGVLGNDNDAANPNGPLTAPTHDPLSVVSIDTSATKGIVTMNPDGTFSYDPNGQFEYLGVGQSENDTFTYTVADNDGGTTTETVTVKVTGANDEPVAVEDVVTVFEGGQGGSETVSGNALGNDSDLDQSGTPEDDVIRVVNIRFEGTPFGGATQAGGAVSPSGTLVNGLYGTLSINANGEFVYTVDGNLPTTRALDTGDVGVETFTYLISDGNGGFDESQIVVRVVGSTGGKIGDFFGVGGSGILEGFRFAERRIDGDGGSGEPLLLLMPTYSGTAEPGSVITLTVMGADGSRMAGGSMTVVADLSGGWIAKFSGLEIGNTSYFVKVETAAPAWSTGVKGTFEVFFAPAINGSHSESDVLTVDSILGRRLSSVAFDQMIETNAHPNGSNADWRKANGMPQ